MATSTTTTTTPAYTVREATPDDAAALSALAERTFVHLATTVHKEDITPEDLAMHVANTFPVEKMRAEITHPKKTTIFLFEVEDPVNPCGFATIIDGNVRPGDEGIVEESDCIEIKRVYVDVPCIGTGAAKFLMDKVMTLIHAKRSKVLWVGTGSNNFRAQRFYQKLGFELSGKFSYKIGSVTREDVVLTLCTPSE